MTSLERNKAKQRQVQWGKNDCIVTLGFVLHDLKRLTKLQKKILLQKNKTFFWLVIHALRTVLQSKAKQNKTKPTAQLPTMQAICKLSENRFFCVRVSFLSSQLNQEQEAFQGGKKKKKVIIKITAPAQGRE